MQNYTPLVPGIYLCLFLAVYLFFPVPTRSIVQANMKQNINLLLICNLILVAISISAALMMRTLIPDYAAWGALIILAAISFWKIFSSPEKPAAPDEETNVLKGMKL